MPINCDIISNNTLKQKIEANSRIEVIDDWSKVLQYVAALLDNELPGIAKQYIVGRAKSYSSTSKG